ncbi:ribosomal protein L3 [Candidatus Carsonella ruddii PV]|uniref:Large ribosomal subunit protein uL3 n=2 Tax=Carsonella ruddii TaxID=114186 RepID=Q9AIG4_CARRU|nr:50S ribosomal protein L3 [Candidatus Carsonella ruddii]AAK17082.1 ribosomal protein L3 [Candidatus Carsonella ruddii]BAF35186.1 ribosomal protein L3 [Candidatus Carsonella ruddii PV]
MIFINKGSFNFYVNNKFYLLNVIKYSKFNKKILNFKIKTLKIISISKGKGFAGVIKKWNFKTKDKSHGCSLSYRTLGSVGQCQDPGRVFKGKKMPGKMGNKKNTFFVDVFLRKKNIFFIKKIIPGSKNDYLYVDII